MNQRVNLEASWQALLKDQFELPYMQALRDFLLEEKAPRQTDISPRRADVRCLRRGARG